MKALVYTDVEALSFAEVPDPVPHLGDHLIRVEAAGICGSDMHAYLGHDSRRPAPLILGHEAAGTIVGGARDGERVFLGVDHRNQFAVSLYQAAGFQIIENRQVWFMARPDIQPQLVK